MYQQRVSARGIDDDRRQGLDVQEALDLGRQLERRVGLSGRRGGSAEQGERHERAATLLRGTYRQSAAGGLKNGHRTPLVTVLPKVLPKCRCYG